MADLNLLVRHQLTCNWCQKTGIAAFIDAEHAFDRFYAQNLVNIDELIISQPDHGESLEIADNLIRSGAIDVIVIDLAALTPKVKLRVKWEIQNGLHARLMSQALRN